MKITRGNGKVLDQTDCDALRVADLVPGDVFRFVRGHPDNIYIMGHGKSYFLIPSNQEFPCGKLEAISRKVYLFPKANLVLGPKAEFPKQLTQAERRKRCLK